ncbi:MAG: FlgD immunoglobulin-like domain containing protein [Candidatus Krumholzibacteriota bacterium]
MLRRQKLFCLAILALAAGLAAVDTAQAQTISYYSFYDKVGSGLQTAKWRALLSDTQHGGITVHIESPDTNLVLVTADENVPGAAFADVFVPNGDSFAEFYLQALEDTTGTVDVTASAPGFTDAVRAVDVLVPSLHLVGLVTTIDPFAPDDAFFVSVGLANAGNTNLSAHQKVRVGGPGLTATFTSSDVAVAELVTTALTAQVVSVAIAPGESNSPTSVAAGGVALDGLSAGTVDIDAAIPGFIPTTSIPKTVTVTAPVVTWTSLPTSIGSGLQVNTRYVRVSGSQHGGVTVHVAVGDSNAILVAPDANTVGSSSIDLFIPDGLAYATFSVQVLEGVTGDFAITGDAPGFAQGYTTVTAAPPFFRFSGLETSIDTLDPVDPFVISIGLPNGSLTGLSQYQDARTGGAGITATVFSSDEAVGLLETSTTLDDTAVVYIAPGDFSSPNSVATGGVAMDGIAVGTTQVTASLPGFAPVTTGIVDVTVTQPSINLISFHTTIGAGLETGKNWVSLGASQHGGVTVHIESLNPALVLVSSHADSVGTPWIDIFAPNGTTSLGFWMHALEDTVGTATIQATSPLFLPDSDPTNVVRPALRLNGLNPSVDTIDPDDAFYVSIGYPNPGFTSITNQDVRPGSAGFEVDLTLDDPVVGRFVTLADTGDSLTLTIPAGANITPGTVATGGVAFDGLSAGVTQVEVSSPRADQITTSFKTVTVTAPTISSSITSKVGAGLQINGYALLSATNHGGVTVSITSNDPALLLLATGNLDPGQASINVFVPNGTPSVPFWVQGVDGTVGMADFQISAPQFVATADSIEVVQPGVEIVSLGATIDVSDAPDQFYARVGVPEVGNASVQAGFEQERRGGEPPLVVTLISSAGAVAELAASPANDDTVTVQIVSGSKTSPMTIGAGGTGLIGLSSGQTIVTAAIPGFIQTGDAQVVVDVTNQTIALNGLTTRLGAGLQSEAVSAELGESGHGGVTVHVETPDSTLVLISTNALVAGAGSVDIFLANGETEAVFYVQALEGAAGNTIAVVAGAPTFSDGNQNVDMVAPGTAITLLADSMDVNVDDDEFVIQIGAVSVDGTGIFETQPIRGGGAARTLTVYSSLESVALIETSSTSDDTATVTLDPGEFQTPGTVAGGGVAFNPVLGGEVVVSASIPGFTTTAAGMPTITVTGEVVGVGDVVRLVNLLAQNYPNPFNPRTTIAFSLARSGPVTLKVYDIAGRVVRTFHAGEVLSPGAHEAVWAGRNDQGSGVAAGVYLYRLETPDYQAVKRMTLIK